MLFSGGKITWRLWLQFLSLFNNRNVVFAIIYRLRTYLWFQLFKKMTLVSWSVTFRFFFISIININFLCLLQNWKSLPSLKTSISFTQKRREVYLFKFICRLAEMRFFIFEKLISFLLLKKKKKKKWCRLYGDVSLSYKPSLLFHNFRIFLGVLYIINKILCLVSSEKYYALFHLKIT